MHCDLQGAKLFRYRKRNINPPNLDEAKPANAAGRPIKPTHCCLLSMVDELAGLAASLKPLLYIIRP
jgi:hypothetical protein